ncbi:MAG: ATP-binding protein [Bryobacteraceae bacterium]|nr:ATP-binding protein [Bryobacteraceae bacterium]
MTVTEQALVLDSALAELPRLESWIDEFAAREGLPDSIHYHLNVALEELVINAIKHGQCQPAEEAIRLSMILDGGVLRIELSDCGIAFDPLQAPAPDLALGLKERPIGGLGVHLVRCLMDSVDYERRDGRNRLLLTKRVEGGAP